jgi:hypothetical protein
VLKQSPPLDTIAKPPEQGGRVVPHPIPHDTQGRQDAVGVAYPRAAMRLLRPPNGAFAHSLSFFERDRNNSSMSVRPFYFLRIFKWIAERYNHF